jgi:SAM-dependent methyltransferase
MNERATMSELHDAGTLGGSADRYAFGHAEWELDRLQVQARILEPFTRQLLLDAGIGSGMRVLDVGSGTGDVALLAAELVGDAGEMVGTDRSAAALAIAKARASARALANVSFQEGDPTELTFGRPFDAVIGRYVLEFQRDPGVWLARLVACVRPGGVIAFQEVDLASARSFPTVPSWDRCCELIVATVKATGADPLVGMKLYGLFAGAGLPPPSLRYVTRIGAGRDNVQMVTNAMVTLLSEMERLGLVRPGEVDPTTLLEQVLADVTARGSIVVGWSDVGAWSTVSLAHS